MIGQNEKTIAHLNRKAEQKNKEPECLKALPEQRQG